MEILKHFLLRVATEYLLASWERTKEDEKLSLLFPYYLERKTSKKTEKSYEEFFLCNSNGRAKYASVNVDFNFYFS